MKLRYSTLLVLFLALGCSSAKDSQTSNAAPPANTQRMSMDTDELLEYQDEITAGYLRSHLTPFSADSMEGRETGMPGQKKAAEYLARQYEALGMKPVGDNNTYYQKFDLTAQRTDSVVFMTYRQGESGRKENISETKNSASSTGNYIRQFGGDTTINANIVFAGYGLQNENLGINNFENIDVAGKWVMIFEDVPRIMDGDTLYTSSRQFNQMRIGTILQKGVAGILIVPESLEDAKFEKALEGNQQSFGKPAGMQLAYREQVGGGPAWSYNTIRPSHAAKILGVDDLTSLKEKLSMDRSFTADDTGYGLTQIPYVQDVTLASENIAAYLEGSDPQLKDEVVVLSAHYDHVGIGAPDSTGDAIYNGANDDGSGTIGILSAARAFAKAKEDGVGPRRSILFLSVSGEEKGLLGSRYYSDHPIFPMEKTVANINTDMIGRVDPEHKENDITDYVYIIGAEIISSEMDSLLKLGNSRSGQLALDMKYNDLNDPNQFYRRSDHWNFGRFGVPFIFFFNGVHEDYHRPSDEIDKMNFPLFTKTVRSMYATTVMVANADRAPKVDNQEFIEITKEN